ncbi:hypothetical protein BABINDRAFT_160848 [Babjeviella inositovora NRRL Y-12698]|uniref:Uncharacterized protein n=1 Tax=Babjeviella inositovora NRRL Y-12698 TaxID=984486 RepID=A0A1E3QSB6_9ASCO|nr:uncharacterized protein BABINDRAFT_160848 [Babjeviella inositovora NRRL Y-12698]ODQ80589.1 hypothetical protein BABINDRAFT_160848 [Babjeviella inositovora NRRL Y-12698]
MSKGRRSRGSEFCHKQKPAIYIARSPPIFPYTRVLHLYQVRGKIPGFPSHGLY